MNKKLERKNGESALHFVGVDGTWQRQGDGSPTNIELLYEAVAERSIDGRLQLPKHFNGVATSGNKFERLVNGVTGADLPELACGVYRHCSSAFENGDGIILGGFSRGAFTVRSVNGMAYNVGLIDPSKITGEQAYMNAILEAYDIYRDKDMDVDHPEAIRFKEKLSYDVEPKIGLALFDTVGVLGIPHQFGLLHKLTKGKYDFHDLEVNPNTTFAIHALALDEQRSNYPQTPIKISEHSNTVIDPMLFIGNHSTVGGGVEANKELSDISGLWMAQRLQDLGGLGFETTALREVFKPNALANIDTNFRQGGLFWKLAGFEDRKFSPNIKIHPSVAFRMEQMASYDPAPVRGRDIETRIADIPQVDVWGVDSVELAAGIRPQPSFA